jgi:hypothetical protein
MATAVGRCFNFDLCTTADRRTDIEVPEGAPFVCPECGNALGEPPLSGQRGGRRFLMLAAVLVIVVGGAIYITSKLAPKNNLAGASPPWVPSTPRSTATNPPGAVPTLAPTKQ